MERNELSIGEVGVIDGVKVRCVKATDEMRHWCFDCAFNTMPCKSTLCIGATRSDHTDVYFKKIEE